MLDVANRPNLIKCIIHTVHVVCGSAGRKILLMMTVYWCRSIWHLGLGTVRKLQQRVQCGLNRRFVVAALRSSEAKEDVIITEYKLFMYLPRPPT